MPMMKLFFIARTHWAFAHISAHQVTPSALGFAIPFEKISLYQRRL